MNKQNQATVVTAKPSSSFSSLMAGFLQRKCACGQHTIAGGECSACGEEREGSLQRSALSRNSAPGHDSVVPPIVHEVLNSPGQPLDRATRTFFEPRFGHDFSRVRVHTSSKAAESAQAISALAYTVGHDIVFGAGQYRASTSAGRRLLAHELTHVVQQGEGFATPASTIGSAHSEAEREADEMSEQLGAEAFAENDRETSDPTVLSDVQSSVGAQTKNRTDRPQGEEDPTLRADTGGRNESGSRARGDSSDLTSRSRGPANSGFSGGTVRRKSILHKLTEKIRRSVANRGVIRRTVTNLAVAGAAAEATAADHFVAPRGAAPVTVTATTSAAGQVVNWTGGRAQRGNPLQRVVGAGAAGATVVTADTPADPGSQSVTVHVLNGRTAPPNTPAQLSFSRQPGIPPGFPHSPGEFGFTDVRVNNPTARIRAGVAGNQWAFQVERISHRYQMAVAAPRINIPTAASATNANHCQVITDMTPAGPITPPPNLTFWCKPIVEAHEFAHVARFYSPPFWEGSMRLAETNIEAVASNVNVDHTIPATLSDSGVVAANAVAHQAILDAQLAAADAAEIAGAEPFAHGQSNAMFNTLVAQIAARFRPLAPTALVAAAPGPTTVQLNWADNACNETEYRVYRRRGRGAFTRVVSLPPGSVAFTDTLAGLAGNTDFTYFVTAFGVAGESNRSNQVAIHTP